jgi:hypothetical protein
MIGDLIGQINRLSCHVHIDQSRLCFADQWSVFVHDETGKIVAHTGEFATITGALHNALQLTKEAQHAVQPGKRG